MSSHNRRQLNLQQTSDLTYVPTWAGAAYVCFIDAHSCMVVGWRVASHMRTMMVLDAIEMARWWRGTQLDVLHGPLVAVASTINVELHPSKDVLEVRQTRYRQGRRALPAAA